MSAAVPSRAADPSAEALIEAGHWKRARALVAPRIQAHPDNPQLNYLMSQIDAAFNELDAARSLAERSVALASGDARYHRQLADVYGETAETASLFAKGGWAKRFKAEAEEAAQLDPKNVDARFDLLEYDLQAPRLMGGSKDKAAAVAEEIGKIDPVEGDVAQARLAQDRKDRSSEETWRLKALAARPDDYELILGVAAFYARPPAPSIEKSLQFARRAIEAQPSRAEAYSELAAGLASEDKWTELDGMLVKARKNVPDDLVPYYSAALAIVSANGATAADLARAETYFRTYLSSDPEGGEPSLAHAHWKLGLVLEKEGRIHDALAEVREAIRLKPDLWQAQKDLKRLEQP
jgi:tetratricopeptide (TPR) repeat protein